MAKTFRQEVEEIIKEEGCHKWKTDRICEAAKRMGERMPKFQSDIEVVGKAVEVYRTRCQAHIMREIEDNG